MGNKSTFWQAFIVAMAIFLIGIFLGILFEQNRADVLRDYYINSETNIFDINLQSDLAKISSNCSEMTRQQIRFADRIFNEARELEKYDSSTKITLEVFNLHRRYDLLRTMLWTNLISSNCNLSAHIVVYLYQYDKPSPQIKAEQATMSSVLLDLKEKYGDEFVLIPIASDMGLESLEILKEKYRVKEIPVVLIDQKYKISKLVSMEEIEKYIT